MKPIKVVVWQAPHFMVMAWNENGEQVPEYQAPLLEIIAKLRNLPDATEFQRGLWGVGSRVSTKEEVLSLLER